MDTNLTTIIVVGTIAFIILSFVLAGWLTRRMFGGSKKKRAQAKRLVETGSKARATILSIRPTGMVVNHINIKCDVVFRLDPLDGSASFEGSKSPLINQTRMPQVGDVWPAWFDPADRSTFAVGQPDLGDPQSQQVLREFGIAHPLAPPSPGATEWPTADGTADRMANLEKLADMRSRGLLSHDEFEAEKKRLLES